MPDLLSFLGEVALRSSFILVVVFALLSLMKRASASERHLVAGLGLLAVTFVPVGLLLSPKVTWTISFPRQLETSITTQKMDAPLLAGKQAPLSAPAPILENTSALQLLTISNGLIALLVAGMLAQAVMLGQAAWLWQKIRRQAVKASLPDGILARVQAFTGAKTVPPILTSDRIAVPLLAGWLRPVIILPGEAPHWPSERLAMVLYHELAHFRRCDSAMLPLICILRILYWWNPLVWLALSRLLHEREMACDDMVLNHNFRATDYAELIVSAARQARRLHWPGGAMAMASSPNFSRRVRAILNPSVSRRQASRGMTLAGFMIALALGWFLIALQVQAETEEKIATPDATDNTAKRQVELEFKCFKIDEKTYVENQQKIDTMVVNSDAVTLVNFANHTSGVNLLSIPSVTTQDGLRAKIGIVREMSYAITFDKDKNGKITPLEFRTRDVGLSIDCLPKLTADCKTVDVAINCEVTAVIGWNDVAPGIQQPIFDTNRTRTQLHLGKQSAAIWIGNAPLQTKPPQRILLLVSARPVPPSPPLLPIPGVDMKKLMVRIELKFFQITPKTYAQQPDKIEKAFQAGDLDFLSHLPGFNLLSDLTTYTKVGEQATIESVRRLPPSAKFIHPDTQNSRLCGIRVMTKNAVSKEGIIDLSIFPEITFYEGMSNDAGSQMRPVFNTARGSPEFLLRNGGTMGAWVGTDVRDMSKTMGDRPYSSDLDLYTGNPALVRVGMIFTANLYTADGKRLSDQTSSPLKKTK